MAKPITGKTHIGERREKRPNGDIYVYERITAYDAEKRKTYTVSQKLKGKIKAGTDELVPTRPKRKKGEEKEIKATRTHTGLTDILKWVGKNSKIDRDLEASFSEGDAQKISSIAQYLLATNGNSLPRLESWQIMHPLPYTEGISEDVYGTLFKNIGRDESGIQNYFSCRARRLGKSAIVAFDSTTVSTYSDNQFEARQGFNKDGDGLDALKLLTLYSVKDREPIAFSKQPGNIPDVISIENALKQLKYLNMESPLIVTDNGYYSQGNMMKFALKNMKFLMLVESNITWIRKVIDSLQDELSLMSSTCPFDPSICGSTASVMHDFTHIRKRSRKEKSAGEEETFSRRLYVHVFYSSDKKAKKELKFREQLLELKSQLELGVTEFTKAAQKKIDKYFICSTKGRGGKLKISFNDKEITKATKYFGYFTLVSSKAMDTFTALENYRLREKIEELFKVQKSSLDGARPRVWYPDSLRGKQFVQFIALGYHCFLTKKIKEVQLRIQENKENKTKALIKTEEQLEKWLKKRSLTQILDWFDCIETTNIQTPMGQHRWSTESIERDRLFLKYLGVLKE